MTQAYEFVAVTVTVKALGGDGVHEQTFSITDAVLRGYFKNGRLPEHVMDALAASIDAVVTKWPAVPER